MILSRLLGSVANSLDSLGNILSSTSSLIETEINAVKHSRKADHLINHTIGNETKLRIANNELENITYKFDQKAKSKGKHYHEEYNTRLVQRLGILDLLNETEEDM